MGQLLQQSKVHQALNGAWQIQDHCMDIQIHTSLYIQLILHTAQPITYVTFQQIHVELTTPIRAPTYTSHPETTPSHHQLSRPICFHLERWIDTDLDPYGVQNHDVLTGTTEYPSLQWGIQFNIKKIWIGMDSYPS